MDHKFLEAVAVTVKARMEENQAELEAKYSKQMNKFINQTKKDFEDVMTDYLTGVNTTINEFLGELLNMKNTVGIDKETRESFKKLHEAFLEKINSNMDKEAESLEKRLADLKRMRIE